MKVFMRPLAAPLLVIIAVLLPIYLTTLQTIPNGAENYFMIDVGETQIVLNRWGTLHATGYPLYVMVSNLLVAPLRLLGVSAAAAPGLTSLIYGIFALALVYVLAINLTGRRWISAATVILFGLTRTVWIHQAIAEIYSFGLLLLVLLLLIALWQRPIRGRIYWLAFIGGLGVFHHRALLMAAPALLYAVWGEFKTPHSHPLEPIHKPPKAALTPPLRRPAERLTLSHKLVRDEGRGGRGVRFMDRYLAQIARTISVSLLLGLLGFLPYAYLPLRAQAGAQWVYGQPNTWAGFWDQFLGREASRFIGAPASLDGLLANFNLVNTVLVTDLTLPGILLGLVGLLLALRNPARRRAAVTTLLSGGTAYVFHVLLYTDVLSALILPVTLSLAFGWLLLAEWAIQFEPQRRREREDIRFEPQRHRVTQAGLAIGFLIGAAILVNQNWGFIRDLTTNRTGLETIELARGAPPSSTLMLDWGPRHFALGFARDVLGELPEMRLVDHKADFATLIQQSQLVTADFTFYNRPVSWWEQQLGARVYLHAAAPHLVAIAVQPEIVSSQLASADIQMIEPARLDCTADALNLHVAWVSGSQPDHDLSVFVHLLDSSGTLIAQADQSAPVYGWRPLTTWEAGEVVRDIYPLPHLPLGELIHYGLYRQLPSGEFVNEYEYDMPVRCDA